MRSQDADCLASALLIIYFTSEPGAMVRAPEADLMVKERLRAKDLDRLRLDLSQRDICVLESVGELRLMTTKQIRSIHFASEDYPSPHAAVRSCNRCLDRLVDCRALVRLSRRVGGVRGGSSVYIYSLGSVGQRLLNSQGPRRGFREPSASFVDHTLAVSQLAVDLTVAARRQAFDLLAVQAEPRSWRTFTSPSGRVLLRPDAYVALGIGEYEHRYFIEMDMGTEHVPALLRKCHLYEAYYASGKEQARNEVFPRVCWLMPSTERAKRLKRAIVVNGQLTPELFMVVGNEHAVAMLSGVAT